jgi:hypothetical protein
MIPRRFVLLISILLMSLAGCSAETPETLPDVEPITVHITPATRPASAAVQACALEVSSAVVRILERFSGEEGADLTIRLDLPQGQPGFLAQIAEEELAAVLHPEQEAASLTPADLRRLFAGQAVNWEELGGDDLQVQVWSLYVGDESRQALEAGILRGQPLAADARLAPDPGTLQAAVAEDPAAIGFVPAAWHDGELTMILTGIRLPVLVQAAETPTGPAAQLVACLQGETGQAVLADVYP